MLTNSSGAGRFTRLFAGRPAPAAAPASAQPVFEYTGPATLTLASPVTGRSYVFARPGCRQATDARDLLLLSRHPDLTRII